ncbi:MAG: TrbG/VirB9 family P-type conjugative transfer protein [Deltaproteobacteria bacterium]|nr:TrbG/VirB9 family P-type conjugative transfer protein [Deltaproteobacteria bacterium]
MKRYLLIMFVFVFCIIPGRAFAAGHVAHFMYTSDKIYKIYCRPGFLTDIEAGGKIEAFVLGDTVRWMSAKVGDNIFVKPVLNHISTSATLITGKQTYQFQLISSKTKYFQLVKFSLPADMVMFKSKPKTTFTVAKHAQNKRLLVKTLDKMNFNFTVSGNKSLRPVQVFAYNGFTYLEMRKKLQSEPVFFILRNGRLALVNYVVRGRYIIVERRFKKGALKLGKKEAFIYLGRSTINNSWW